MSSEGLELTIRGIAPFTMAMIVTMPPPQHEPEAYFVGMVLGPDGLARYFVLEKAESVPRSSTGANLCEWLKIGMHADLPRGPRPTLQAFVVALSDIVRQTGPMAPAAADG
jgi:hypothetical protein